MSKVEILKVAFDNYTHEEFMARFKKRILNHEKTLVVTANPEIVMFAQENQAYLKLLQTQADYITADGIGVVKAAKALKTPLKQRVTGYDLFLDLLKYANQEALKVYLIGATPTVIAKCQEMIEMNYHNIQLVGVQDGYFEASQTSDIQTAIKEKQPDLIFAALGFPKQEFFLAELLQELPNGFGMGVGGSFDVFSGTVKRAPVIFQKAHLEWFYRLITHPTRLKRMLVLPKFMLTIQKRKKQI